MIWALFRALRPGDSSWRSAGLAYIVVALITMGGAHGVRLVLLAAAITDPCDFVPMLLQCMASRTELDVAFTTHIVPANPAILGFVRARHNPIAFVAFPTNVMRRWLQHMTLWAEFWVTHQERGSAG